MYFAETFRGEETNLEAGTFHFNLERSSFTDNGLPLCLRQASNVDVKSLILSSKLFNFAAVDWDELPTKFQAALQHVICLPIFKIRKPSHVWVAWYKINQVRQTPRFRTWLHEVSSLNSDVSVC